MGQQCLGVGDEDVALPRGSAPCLVLLCSHCSAAWSEVVQGSLPAVGHVGN